jgi:hypothetical protein
VYPAALQLARVRDRGGDHAADAAGYTGTCC